MLNISWSINRRPEDGGSVQMGCAGLVFMPGLYAVQECECSWG